MDMDQVNGFSELDVMQQELFRKVHKKHQDSLQEKDKHAYSPVEIKWDKRKYCLVVKFKNMDWMHYTVTGHWY